jgi:hypothetical protein
MREYIFIKEKIIEKHDIVDNYEYLDKYINLLINYELKDCAEYTEKHHILPRSTFPEFEFEDWNIIELKYEDHKLSHLWIFKAINIRKYQRPLNWMMNYYKNKEELSNASKNGWVNFKNDEVKYNKWRFKKSEYMKGLSSDEQKRRANIFWDNISDEKYLEFYNKMKGYWTPIKRLEKSINMKSFYSDSSNVNRKRIETQERWDSMDMSDREEFKKKMSIINKGGEKRKLAGIKIKEKWKDEEYLNKMKERKHRSGVKLKVIRPNGDEIIFDTMKDLTDKYNFNPYLIRKYKDQNIKIHKKHLKEVNIILLDCIIESIKI